MEPIGSFEAKRSSKLVGSFGAFESLEPIGSFEVNQSSDLVGSSEAFSHLSKLCHWDWLAHLRQLGHWNQLGHLRPYSHPSWLGHLGQLVHWNWLGHLERHDTKIWMFSSINQFDFGWGYRPHLPYQWPSTARLEPALVRATETREFCLCYSPEKGCTELLLGVCRRYCPTNLSTWWTPAYYV